MIQLRSSFLLVVFLLASCGPVTPVARLENSAIQGVVVSEEDLPITGALVRIKTTEQYAITKDDGTFKLANLAQNQPIILTAFAPGYYIGGGESFAPGTTDAIIVLKKHSNTDNPEYEWMSALSSEGKAGNCQNCHEGIDPNEGSLPFTEWKIDAHANTLNNIRFMTMYSGTDIAGNQSPLTQYGTNRDYGRIPLRPDLSQPYYGPGYKLDFPDTSGNCAACHAPAAAIDLAYDTDPTTVSGVGKEGVACDFCHKVWNVNLDLATGMPYPNTPGALSFEFRRPHGEHQFFAGPFDDVAPGEDTYTPIQRQSQFCAPCHSARFWDTQIYDSFGEWLASPYSDPQTGKTCQDCHMPVGLNNHFARIDKGGMTRDPKTIFSHRMPGASDETLLKNAVTMTATTKIEADRLIVDVSITNDKTGHHVPSDSPLRQLILLLIVRDDQGNTLPLIKGETIPEYGGVGDPEQGYYAGYPGKIYAKILMELWTEISPTGAYWNPTRIASDNRLAAFTTDRTTYIFATPMNQEVIVDVRLIFRRAFKELMDQKSWDVPDILMEVKEIVITP